MDTVPDLLLPPGYTLEEDWLEQHEGTQVPDEHIRLYEKRIRYVFDPENEEYHIFLQAYRQHTSVLSRAIQTECDTHSYPVWARFKPRKEYAKTFRRMRFLLRPLYFSTLKTVNKTFANRMQGSEDQDHFILHVDEQGTLQTVRWWRSDEEGVCGIKDTMRASIVNTLLERRAELSAASSWEEMAHCIVAVLRDKEVHRLFSHIET